MKGSAVISMCIVCIHNCINIIKPSSTNSYLLCLYAFTDVNNDTAATSALLTAWRGYVTFSAFFMKSLSLENRVGEKHQVLVHLAIKSMKAICFLKKLSRTGLETKY